MAEDGLSVEHSPFILIVFLSLSKEVYIKVIHEKMEQTIGVCLINLPENTCCREVFIA